MLFLRGKNSEVSLTHMCNNFECQDKKILPASSLIENNDRPWVNFHTEDDASHMPNFEELQTIKKI